MSNAVDKLMMMARSGKAFHQPTAHQAADQGFASEEGRGESETPTVPMNTSIVAPTMDAPKVAAPEKEIDAQLGAQPTHGAAEVNEASAESISESSMSPVDRLMLKTRTKHTAHAAKSLTALFAALVSYPGTGKESGEDGQRALNYLLTQTHVTADKVFAQWKHVCEGVDSKALRQLLTQQIAFYFARQWRATRQINASEVESLVSSYIASAPTLLKGMSGAYVPMNDEQQEAAHLLDALTQANMDALFEVKKFNWSWGRDPIAVAGDLARMANEISEVNALASEDVEMRTLWRRNSLTRASTLVRAHYDVFTKTAIDVSKQEDVFSEASLVRKEELYPSALEHIKARAQTDFNFVEKNAMAAMGDAAHALYLPKLGQGLDVQEIKDAALRRSPAPI